MFTKITKGGKNQTSFSQSPSSLRQTNKQTPASGGLPELRLQTELKRSQTSDTRSLRDPSPGRKKLNHLIVTNLLVPCLAQWLLRSIGFPKLNPSDASFSSTFLNAP